jgi:flavin reductase (DIM6/NTAB) family NADH-FMN oxidoreductase RutF
MELDAGSLDYDASYKLLTGAIVPRPIAWVTTCSLAGLTNAAPFSAFTLVSPNPPMVMFLSSRREREKDTERNARESRQFVINIGAQASLNDLHLSSADLPADESELERFGIRFAPSATVRPPRIVDAPVCFECDAIQFLEFGKDPHTMIIGQVKHFFVRDDLYSGGRIDQERLQPIARVGGPNYARLGEIIHMPPPKVERR